MKIKQKKEDKPRALTRKEQAFVKELLQNPELPIYKAFAKAYGRDLDKVKRPQSIRTEASGVMNRASVKNELQKYSSKAEGVIQSTMTDFQDSEDIHERRLANDNAKYIHDKVHGKATQKIEKTSKVVTIDFNLSDKALMDAEQNENIVEGEVVE